MEILKTALDLLGISSLIDLRQPLFPQVQDFLISVEGPYSSIVSNGILIFVALVIVVLGIAAGWTARHHDESLVLLGRLRKHRVIASMESRLRQVFNFLVRRFRLGGAFGLSFSISFVALVLGIWIFSGVLEDVLAHNGAALFDVPIMHFVITHRVGLLTEIMKVITDIGSAGGTFVILFVAGIFLRYRTGSWRPLLFLLFVVGGAGLLDLALKFLVARPRPAASWMLVSEGGFAFPSGHTTLSVLYGALAYLFGRTYVRWRKKIALWVVAIVVIFLIGISRVYLGVHWPTDVLGGWALAGFWLFACILATTFIESITGTAIFRTAGFPFRHETVSLESETSRVSTFQTPPEGLSDAQVKERYARGESNSVSDRSSRSVWSIIRTNVCTRFNALLGGLFVLVLLVSEKQDALFGIVMIGNTLIGIVQELRAKRTLDRLSLGISPHALVMRDGKLREMRAAEIVLDDIVELRAGDHIAVDGVVLSSDHIEVDESLLTGESDPIAKAPQDTVLSGSFVIAGSARIQATRVGEETYARHLTVEARQFTLSPSELRLGINRLLRYVSFAIMPMAFVLFLTQLIYSSAGWRDAVVSSIGGLVGMVPQGLVLLSSVVMATAVIRLGRSRALVQELSAVEMLARVDTLLLDKTGTLTTGAMTCDEIITRTHLKNNSVSCSNPISSETREIRGGVLDARRRESLALQPKSEEHEPEAIFEMGSMHNEPNAKEALGAFARVFTDQNASLKAIAETCAKPVGNEWDVVRTAAFSSARKWSSVEFRNNGTWILGAPEIVFSKNKETSSVLEKANVLAKTGKRVLAFARSQEPLQDEAVLPAGIRGMALIVLSEHIRDDVAKTISYLRDEGVNVKVLSGDHPETVAAVARTAGIRNGLLPYDARNLPTDSEELSMLLDRHQLFGRVTPEQKRLITRTLEMHGHTVAMMGDGINDVLAIKESNFGIALGTGTSASRAVAQLILLDDTFSALPHVIAEGRRVIANVETTANLFITKTVYVFCLSVAIGIALSPFPFLPRHLTLIDFFTVGTPALFLSFAKNTTRSRSGFVSRILRFALPAGTITAAATLVVFALAKQWEFEFIDSSRTAATIVLLGAGLCVLALNAPMKTAWQQLFLAVWPVLLVFIFVFSRSRDFFLLVLPSVQIWAVIAVVLGVTAVSIKKFEMPAR